MPPDTPTTTPTATGEAVAASLYPSHAEEVVRTLLRGFSYTRADCSRHVYRMASRFEAEDICHEAMAVVLRQIRRGRFDLERPVRPYLVRIACHLALRHARRAHREVVLPEQMEFAPAPTDASHPDETEVRAFREQLDDVERAVLTLTFEQGCTQSDTADRLGLSRDQVYRAMCRLRAAAMSFFRSRGGPDDP